MSCEGEDLREMSRLNLRKAYIYHSAKAIEDTARMGMAGASTSETIEAFDKEYSLTRDIALVYRSRFGGNLVKEWNDHLARKRD